MIKNGKQAASAKGTLAELEKNLVTLKNLFNEKSREEYELKKHYLEELITDLRKEITVYQGLVEGNFHCFHPSKLDEINKVLIAARIASKVSQKELAEKVGIKEQQIQRYESTDYEAASWTRIQEIAYALGINFYFEKIILINETPKFQKPTDTDQNMVDNAKDIVKRNQSLMCIQ